MTQLLTDAQVRGALLLLYGGRLNLRRHPKRQPRPLKLERTCTDCGLTLPLQAFVAIKGTKTGYYGRCGHCRAKRARERYRAKPLEREKQKARVRWNRARRRATAERLEGPARAAATGAGS